MELTGTIQEIKKTESYGNKGFTKRRMLLKTEGDFSQILPVDFLKEKADALNSFNPGDDVKIFINLRGNTTMNGNIYVNILGWRIEKL